MYGLCIASLIIMEVGCVADLVFGAWWWNIVRVKHCNDGNDGSNVANDNYNINNNGDRTNNANNNNNDDNNIRL